MINGLKFLLSFSIWVAICAAGLAYQSFQLLGLQINFPVIGIVFFCTLTAYNAYWVLCKWYYQKKTKKSHRFHQYYFHFFLILVSTVIVFDLLRSKIELLPYLFISGVFTFLYCAPYLINISDPVFKKLGFVKLVILSATWSVTTVLFPAHEMIATNGKFVLALLVSRFLFLLMLCIIFELRHEDITEMKEISSKDLKSLYQPSKSLIYIILLLYFGSVVLLKPYLLDIFQLLTLILTGLAAFYLYFLSIKKRGYYFYYFWVDGLMLFSALATYLVSIRSFI